MNETVKWRLWGTSDALSQGDCQIATGAKDLTFVGDGGQARPVCESILESLKSNTDRAERIHEDACTVGLSGRKQTSSSPSLFARSSGALGAGTAILARQIGLLQVDVRQPRRFTCPWPFGLRVPNKTRFGGWRTPVCPNSHFSRG